MANKYYTLLVVPDRSSTVKRIRLPRSLLVRTAVVVGVVAVLQLAALTHYLQVVGQVAQSEQLRDDNLQLRNQIRQVQEKVAHITQTLERVERLDQKLRVSTGLSDPDRNLNVGPNLAIGPVAGPTGEPASPTLAKSLAPEIEDPASLRNKLDSLSVEAARQEESMQELDQYFEEQKSLLASTPSIWPTRGWVTSDFGHRLDPYTAERVMHQGLDIATAYGTPIGSPSDGTVIFAGMEGGYGKVLVIDHGYGVKTRYGHLSEIYVHVGELVKRAQKVAAVGNTGRSTGPHLHYEVRVNGLPENPRKFILE